VNVGAVLAGTTPGLQRLFDPHPSSQYGQGGWLTFFSRALEAWGPGVTILALAGLPVLWRASSEGRRLAAVVAAWFMVQTAIRALGLYGSGGYARFLVPVSPLVAVAALAGWRRFFDADVRQRRRAILAAGAAMLLLWIAAERQLVLHRQGRDEAAEFPELHQAVLALRVATAAFCLLTGVTLYWLRRAPRAATPDAADDSAPRTLLSRVEDPPWWASPPWPILNLLPPAAILALIVLAAIALCGPLRAPPEVRLIRESLAAIRTAGYADRGILSASVWVDYLSGRELPPDRPTVRQALAAAPIGTLYAWERQFAASEDHRLPLEVLTSSPCFNLIHRSPPLPYRSVPYLWIFEKIASWPEPGSQRASSGLPGRSGASL